MTRTTHYALASALPAIAAALALSSTPSVAQQAQPTEPAPVTQSAPPPVTDATPATTDTTPAATTDTTASTTTTTTTKTRHAARPLRTAAPKPRATTTVTHTQVTHHAAATPPAAAPAAPQQSRTAETQPPAPNSQSAVAPVVDLNSAPAGQKAAPQPASNPNRMLWIGGAALVLIALAGMLVSLIRRRRDAQAWHEDWNAETDAETEAERESTIEPRHDEISYDEERGVVEPSAFAWAATSPERSNVKREDGDDRLPGETWVQRAYRGPSANNPSVSLKNRLRRAAFFDKRERDVAAGLAEPVDPDAGLPGAMTEEREFA